MIIKHSLLPYEVAGIIYLLNIIIKSIYFYVIHMSFISISCIFNYVFIQILYKKCMYIKYHRSICSYIIKLLVYNIHAVNENGGAKAVAPMEVLRISSSVTLACGSS